MPDKPLDKLDPVDRLIRSKLPSGMHDGVHLTIEFFSGFELFNTRPYHNYESWSDGYRVTDGKRTVQAEDLDDAVAKFFYGEASAR